MFVSRNLLFTLLFGIAITGCTKKSNPIFNVTPTGETKPVVSIHGEDAADDPAIWYNEDNPKESLILATNKKAGLHVYNLEGQEMQFIKVGNVNNVDLRYNFPLSENSTIVLVGASNRSNNSITLFRLDPNADKIVDTIGQPIKSSVDEVYGFCLYNNKKTNKFYAFVNGKNGQIEQWNLKGHADTTFTAELVRTLQLNSQPEGMVADDELGYLYVGEEEIGIWKFSASELENNYKEFVVMSDSLNPNITYDIEGLALYYAPKGKGYLIASSQGNNSYALFNRNGKNKYVSSFHVSNSDLYDGSEETDGLDVINLNLGNQYKSGLLVVQDGMNYEKDTLSTQNFKLVSWNDIVNTSGKGIIQAPNYNNWIK